MLDHCLNSPGRFSFVVNLWLAKTFDF